MISSSLGTARFYQQIGQSYAEMFRGGFTASGFVTAAAAWLGVGKAGALLIGVSSMLFWPLLAIVMGWAVTRWRVYHSTVSREMEQSPWLSRQLALLEEIAENTRVPRAGSVNKHEPDSQETPRATPVIAGLLPVARRDFRPEGAHA